VDVLTHFACTGISSILKYRKWSNLTCHLQAHMDHSTKTKKHNGETNGNGLKAKTKNQKCWELSYFHTFVRDDKKKSCSLDFNKQTKHAYNFCQ
jgi:hypothetical protein